MRIIGIDPGPEKSGVVVYCTERRRVQYTNTTHNDKILGSLGLLRINHQLERMAIERVQSYGISGTSLLRTAEMVGRFWEAGNAAKLQIHLLYRREVLQGLDVSGKGNRDSLVRQRLIEIHGGSRRAACGRKAEPGPLYGVSSHAWSALAVAIVAAEQCAPDPQWKRWRSH